MSTKPTTSKRPDCLNTIRIITAICVLYRHTIAHLNIDIPETITTIMSYFPGVPIFFSLSGFLMWGSIGRSRTFSQYLKKRFWSIYPQLWVAIIIEIIVILLLYKEPIKWIQLGLFTITQSTIFQFWTPEFLRSYGCGCPNGSLWTICVLIQFYFFAYFIYKALHGKNKFTWFMSILVSAIIAYFSPNIESSLPEVFGKLYSQTLLPYLWMFLTAAYIAENKEKVLPFVEKYWFVFIIITITIKTANLDIDLSNYYLLQTITTFAGLLGISTTFPKLNIKTNISYGIYLYHMTVVNALLALNFSQSPLLLFVVIIITCILAWISQKTTGEWSLKAKRSLK